MRLPVLLLALLPSVGCTVAVDHLRDTASEINDSAFDGKVKVEIRYCDRRADPGCWKHQGVFVPGAGSVPDAIHIAPEWYWEPDLYFRGIIAHEMIHAHLYATGQERSQAHPHSWRFRAERETVARALDIPVWAIPDGRHETKLDATRTMYYLERSLAATRSAMNGIMHPDSGSTVGWPTQIYDPE